MFDFSSLSSNASKALSNLKVAVVKAQKVRTYLLLANFNS
jgi:hypothetical protein